MSNMNQTKCPCNGPYTCKIHDGEYTFCSAVDCICHNSPKSDQSGWEARFDKQSNEDVYGQMSAETAKDILRAELLSQSNALKEEMRKKIVDMKFEEPKDWLEWTSEQRRSYLKGIRTAIKNTIHLLED